MNTTPENNPMVKPVVRKTLPWHKRLFHFGQKNLKRSLYLETEKAEILESLRNARNEWTNANINFGYASDQGIIDYYTYQIKACEIRYEYYLKKAKAYGLSAEPLEKRSNA